MPGVRSAIKYGYSNARVKAMGSKLVGRGTLERMLAAKEPGSIAAMLLQTDYKQDVEKFGGVKAMGTLVDFVLSKNLGSESSKLISIAPKDQRHIVTAIVGVWDIDNIKLIVEALASNKSFDEVSRYITDSKYVGSGVAKEAMGTKSVDAALQKLMLQTPYSRMIKPALETYKKTGSVIEANSILERNYYLQLGSTISELMRIDTDAAVLIKKRIDMRNMLTLLRGKKLGADFQKISGSILPNGGMGAKKLEKMFREAKDIDSLVESTKAFDLKQALASYKASKSKPLLLFEIAMMNEIFATALRTVRHSVLSFGAIIGFFYMKEIEVFTLRVLIKGKDYGLSDDEIKDMISWLK